MILNGFVCFTLVMKTVMPDGLKKKALRKTNFCPVGHD